ncbi:MAG: STAS domain-containing protein [Anaerolineales bacterium]
MDITISEKQGSVPVSVLALRGALDGSSYEKFSAEVQKLYDAGTRNLLLDMTELTFLSSAGIAALHRTARVFRGEDRSTFDEGWAAMRAIGNEREGGYTVQKHVKLLNPSERIQDVLDTVGFKAFFEIHTDMAMAVASF